MSRVGIYARLRARKFFDGFSCFKIETVTMTKHMKGKAKHGWCNRFFLGSITVCHRPAVYNVNRTATERAEFALVVQHYRCIVIDANAEKPRVIADC